MFIYVKRAYWGALVAYLLSTAARVSRFTSLLQWIRLIPRTCVRLESDRICCVLSWIELSQGARVKRSRWLYCSIVDGSVYVEVMAIEESTSQHIIDISASVQYTAKSEQSTHTNRLLCG